MNNEIFMEYFKGYSAYKTIKAGIIERSIWYLLSGVMVASVLAITPQKEYFFTYIGRRTLAIYIMHRLVRDICEYVGVYNKLSSNFVTLLICTIISIFITYIFSAKWITDVFNKAFTANYSFLLKENMGSVIEDKSRKKVK